MNTVSDEHGETFREGISQIEEVQWKMEFKYAGWLLLESYKRDTSRRIQGTKLTKWVFN